MGNNINKYTGNVRNGNKDGYGKLYFDNNCTKICYDGNWSENKRSGYGKSFRIDGTIEYDGYWKNDQRHGEGKVFSENGELFMEGQFKNGNIDGSGKICFRDRMIDCEFENGKFKTPTTHLLVFAKYIILKKNEEFVEKLDRISSKIDNKIREPDAEKKKLEEISIVE